MREVLYRVWNSACILHVDKTENSSQSHDLGNKPDIHISQKFKS